MGFDMGGGKGVVAPYSKTIKLLLTSGRASTEVKTGSPQKEEPPKWKK